MIDEKKAREMAEELDLEIEDDIIKRVVIDSKLDDVIAEMRAEMSVVEVVGTLMVKVHEVLNDSENRSIALATMLGVLWRGEDEEAN